jgi:hypothetical protein
MMRAAVCLAVFLLCSCAAFEPKVLGNEMGGTVMRDRDSTDDGLLAAADSHCGRFSKVARISGRTPDGGITFDCVSLSAPVLPGR